MIATIKIESNFNIYAYRKEVKVNDVSYGLTQVLFKTAKDRGYNGTEEQLFEPEINIIICILQK